MINSPTRNATQPTAPTTARPTAQRRPARTCYEGRQEEPHETSFPLNPKRSLVYARHPRGHVVRARLWERKLTLKLLYASRPQLTLPELSTLPAPALPGVTGQRSAPQGSAYRRPVWSELVPFLRARGAVLVSLFAIRRRCGQFAGLVNPSRIGASSHKKAPPCEG